MKRYSPHIDKHSEYQYNTHMPGVEGIIESVHWWLNDQLICDDEDGDFIIRQSAKEIVELVMHELNTMEETQDDKSVF